MIGRTLGRYRVLEQIGAGGMGLVFRAHDERLDRDVALKVLPPGTLTDENARRRFRKEALTLSKLNHPNIETAFDFDTQEGADFLVMELIPGATLDEKLKLGALPEKDVVRLGGQLAEGLAAAHAEGVIHRDLKPGNLRLTPDGRLKVLDFGLAKLIQPVAADAATESLSKTHGLAGTLPYMAPEQLQGQAADARSDIWAAGAVLYELATGRRPFPQPSAPMLTDAILRQAPVPPRAVNANLSPELERILSKALEKDPEHRYQSAKELGADLRRLGISQVPMPVLAAASERSGLFKAGMVAALSVVLLLAVVFGALVLLRQRAAPGGGTPRIESLAVLPLENLSRDPEQEYFADGMTEELTTSLAQLSALRVVSRTSVMRYKGARKPLPEIARELNVDAVVEGSVMRSGDRVRITAQLIRGATDEHLWARSYDRDLRDVLTLQSEVAKDIAAEIQVELTSQEHTRLANSRSVNSDAYEAYLKGRYYWSKRTEEGLKRAIGFYELAIHKDASYAPAYGGLAESYASMGIFQQLPPAEAMPKAKAAAVRALEIDNQVAEAHMALASVLFWYDWDPQGAEREFKHALEVNQNYATAHQRYSAYLVLMGRPEESLAEMRRARELDPLSLTIGASLGSRFLATRQYDLAIQQFQKTLDLDPNFVPARARLVTVYEDKGMYPEALAERKKMASLGDESLNDVIAAEHAYHEFGARGYWRARLAQLSDRAKRQYVSPVDLASCYARLGEKEQVVQWLQKAQEERSAGLVNLNVSPEFDSVRSDPRYRDLMRRVGLPL